MAAIMGLTVATITTVYEQQRSTSAPSIDHSIEQLREKVQNINERHPGNYYVYTLSNPQSGEVQYVGRTNDIGRREKEHKNNPKTMDLDMHSYMGGLSYSEARILEQELMVTYHTLNSAGTGGRNSINGIGVKNPNFDAYAQAFEDFVYNEISNEYYCFIELFPLGG